MASTSELMRRLRKAGFVLRRHGGRHDLYENSEGRIVTVPRHAGEIPKGTYNAILRDAGLATKKRIRDNQDQG